MPRYKARPFGQSITPMRSLSLLMSLMAIWMVYSWVSQPRTWQWLADADEAVYAAVPTAPVTPTVPPVEPPENIVPAKNDSDPATFAEFKKYTELITDVQPLLEREMMLYWKLMAWGRSEPFKKLEARADATTSFSQLWETPDQYRGKLQRLRMHVRRVLRYTAPKNDLNLKNCYEIWGWTEDSKSFPYVVVVPELPPGLRIGPDVRGEIVFVGYFLKLIPYEAFDVKRRAPLLLGRIRQAARVAVSEPVTSTRSLIFLATMISIAIFAGIVIRLLLRFRRPRTVTMLPASLDGLEASLIAKELPVTYDGPPNFDEFQDPNWVPEAAPMGEAENR